MDEILSFRKSDADDYYRILGCAPSSNPDQILREYRTRVLDCHPDKNADDVKAEENFKLLQKAKEVLLDEKRRKSYDKWLCSGIAMPFEKWENLSKSSHTSMHWINKKDTKLMLEGGSGSCEAGCVWERDISATLTDFRNYKL